LTAIVDWTQASWGPAAVDVGHMRWNLAVTYGLDAADEFLRLHQSLAGALDDQPYWDLVTALDVMVGLHPGDWPASTSSVWSAMCRPRSREPREDRRQGATG